MNDVHPDIPVFELHDDNSLKEIQNRIKKGLAFAIKFYFFDRLVLTKVKTITDLILEHQNQDKFSDLLYGGLKEIVINGAKANLKRIIYENNGLTLSDPAHTSQGISILKSYMQENSTDEISALLKQKEYQLSLYFFLSENGLRIEVLNNAGLSEIEESIVRKKFRDALRHDNLLEFLEEQGEVMEGAGLGIFMFVLMLKKMGVNPGYFRIGQSPEGHTISRIEIPFNEKYISVRKNSKNNLAK